MFLFLNPSPLLSQSDMFCVFSVLGEKSDRKSHIVFECAREVFEVVFVFALMS